MPKVSFGGNRGRNRDRTADQFRTRNIRSRKVEGCGSLRAQLNIRRFGRLGMLIHQLRRLRILVASLLTAAHGFASSRLRLHFRRREHSDRTFLDGSARRESINDDSTVLCARWERSRITEISTWQSGGPILMDEMNQLASAVLTLLFAGVMLVAAQIYIGTAARSPASASVLSSDAVLPASFQKDVH